jgi:hypothetical protein
MVSSVWVKTTRAVRLWFHWLEKGVINALDDYFKAADDFGTAAITIRPWIFLEPV